MSVSSSKNLSRCFRKLKQPVQLDATHIFDGLNNFPTHIAHMRLGSFVQQPTAWPPVSAEGAQSGTLLYDIALKWLANDRTHRRNLETHEGRKLRGARRDQVKNKIYPPSSFYFEQKKISIPELTFFSSSRSLRIQKYSTRSKHGDFIFALFTADHQCSADTITLIKHNVSATGIQPPNLPSSRSSRPDYL